MNGLSYLGIGSVVFTTIINIVIILTVKMNDLKHIQKDLDDIKTKINNNDRKLDLLSERVSRIEGKLSVKR